MANGLRWWVIPGALVVLLGTLLRIGGARASAPDPAASGPAASAADPAVAAPQAAGVREASGSRHALDLDGHRSDAFVLGFGTDQADRCVTMTIWRRDAAARGGRSLWSELRPTLRRDGTVPMLGVPAGDYDVEAVLADGTLVRFDGVHAPGTHRANVPAAPQR